MNISKNSVGGAGRFNGWWFALLLAGILGLLFWQSFIPGVVHFSNDGPLGAQAIDAFKLPAGLSGIWYDMNSVGFASGSYSVNITTFVKWFLGPVYYSKFLPPIALFVLGMGAWFLFRQLRFNPIACALGAFAAALGSAFFSTACWGVASQQVAMGMNFISLALIVASDRANSSVRRYTLLALSGAALGVSIMEGLDNGALFSLFIAAFTVYQSIMHESGSVFRRLILGVVRAGVIAVCAGLIAAQTLAALVTTQIQGVAGTGQDTRTRQEKWDWATQWSFPKRETLGLFVPGIFGYRMDTPEGGNYWGAVGRDPAWDRYFENGKQGQPPQGVMRFSGGGNYVGVSVALFAFWAAWQAFRRKDSAFSPDEKKFIWFWSISGVIALLLSYGRFAPFYRLVYALPYFSTIRNPVKFTAIFNYAIVVVFAYGVHGLWKHYVEQTAGGGTAFRSRTRSEKRWIVGCIALVVFSILGWIFYASSQSSLVRYLGTVQFDESMSKAIAGFSVRQVGWFVLFLIGSVVAMILLLNGRLSGNRARVAGILLGLLLVVDLGRADLPWTVFWNYNQKYATNPVIEKLREKPYEQRVAILPFRAPPQFSLFEQLYRIEWAQHHFLYYGIQSMDVIQMPRVPQDLQNFESALHFEGTPDTIYRVTRRWELTSTRYLLGPAGFLDVLNQQIDPEKHRFRIAETFNVVPKPGILNPTKLEELTAESAGTNGMYALFDFTGALPRAKLFSEWKVLSKDPASVAQLKQTQLGTNEVEFLKSIGTNDFLTLERIADPAFDPHKTVLLADNSSVPAPTGSTNKIAGTVEYTSYSSKNIKLKTQSETATVLLLNDKYDAHWGVSVDGKPAELLRCNYLMRGVFLPAGNHEVEFVFRTDLRPMYVTVASMIGALLLIGLVVVSGQKEKLTASSESRAIKNS